MFFKLVTLLPLLASIASINAQVINVPACEPAPSHIIKYKETIPLNTRTDRVESQNLFLKGFTTRTAHFTNQGVSLEVTSVVPPASAQTESYTFVTIDATNAKEGTNPDYDGKNLFQVDYYNLGKDGRLMSKQAQQSLIHGGSKCRHL